MDIAAWLRGLGLEQYAAAFRENDIGAAVLPTLTADELKDLGVTSVGHRRALLNAIAALRGDPSPVQAPLSVTPGPANRSDHAALASSAERRQLTVMFCDLVGSTALASRLDPEDLREVIGSYHHCVAETVARFDGFVAKYMGDGVLIYFGYPAAHEDDAERAVHAGLALVDAVGRLRAPERLQVRVGIGTGLVVVGDLISSGDGQERGVVGETPNLAARLQTLADPDAIVIGPQTRQLLGDLFEVYDLGKVEVKGFAEPVHAYRVLRPSAVESRFEALHSATLSPLVGRDEETELLLERWQRVKNGDGQVVLLSGEPGIGKSRVAAVMQERIASEPHIRLRYFCSPHHQGSALHPAVAQLEHASGFERDDTAATKLDKLEALLAPTSPPKEDAALLAELLSLPAAERYPTLDLSPQRWKERTFEALLRQLELLAWQQPVLAVYEDVHWIDPTSRELLDLAVARTAHLRVLLLITFRPEFTPPWVGPAHVTALTLDRLNAQNGAALVQQIAGNKPLPSDILDEIVERTDGVPLFVEEMAKAVLEAGVDGAGLVLSRTSAGATSVPPTLHASLMSRLDRLGPPVKEIAQVGAAIGREFSHELLGMVAQQGESELRRALDRLTEAGLVFRRGAPPKAVYTFKHALVQDTAYETLLRTRRQELHGRIARVLESDFPEMAEIEPELFAHHCARAGLVERAIVYRHKAGRRAMARSAMTEAVVQLMKALELLATLPTSADRDQTELELRVALGGALVATKGFAAPDVGRTYGRARELCQKSSDSSQILPVLSGLYQYYQHFAGPKAGLEVSDELLQLAERHQDAAGRVAGHRMVGASSLFCGRLKAAREHFDRALALYGSVDRAAPVFLPLPDTGVICRSFTALVLLWQGYPDQALACGGAALDAAGQLSHAFTASQALYLSGWLHQVRGEPPIVRERASAMISLMEERKYPLWLANAKTLHGWALAVSGAPETGIAQMSDGISELKALGVQLHHPSMLGLLASTYRNAGRSDEALALLTEAQAIIASSGERWFEAELYRLRAEVLVTGSSSAASEAEVALHSALTVAREQGAKWWELRAATSLARLWRDQGRRSEAHDLLAPVYGWFTEGFDTLDLQEAKALLDEL